MTTTFLFHICAWLGLNYDLPHVPDSDQDRGRVWFGFWALRRRRR